MFLVPESTPASEVLRELQHRLQETDGRLADAEVALHTAQHRVEKLERDNAVLQARLPVRRTLPIRMLFVQPLTPVRLPRSGGQTTEGRLRT